MKEQVYSLQSAADSSVAERAGFIRRTYLHVAGAIAIFALLEAWLINSSLAEPLIGMMLGSQFSWLLVLGLFMGVSYIADKFAHSQTSEGMQYLGLGLFIVAEAIIFVPILFIAKGFFPGAIETAAYITALLVIGLTSTVFITKKDFSFMGSFLKIAFLVAFGVIICGMIFDFSLGLVFSGAMALLAAGSVLYTTSNILHRYHTGQHVAASLALFSSIALLFWYVLQIVMSFTGRD
jgi:FtsH-binding integral membrane protein